MGYPLDVTPEMGEFSAEIRRESFVLRTGHRVVIYPDQRKRIDESAITAVLPLIDRMRQESSPRVRRALAQDIADKLNEQLEDGPTGTVEIYLEDVPKLRAVLDAVERHLARRPA